MVTQQSIMGMGSDKLMDEEVGFIEFDVYFYWVLLHILYIIIGFYWVLLVFIVKVYYNTCVCVYGDPAIHHGHGIRQTHGRRGMCVCVSVLVCVCMCMCVCVCVYVYVYVCMVTQQSIMGMGSDKLMDEEVGFITYSLY
jgi:hypothetical protein